MAETMISAEMTESVIDASYTATTLFPFLSFRCRCHFFPIFYITVRAEVFGVNFFRESSPLSQLNRLHGSCHVKQLHKDREADQCNDKGDDFPLNADERNGITVTHLCYRVHGVVEGVKAHVDLRVDRCLENKDRFGDDEDENKDVYDNGEKFFPENNPVGEEAEVGDELVEVNDTKCPEDTEESEVGERHGEVADNDEGI